MTSRQLLILLTTMLIAAMTTLAGSASAADVTPPEDDTVLVMELYSSVSCPYCPAAEKDFEMLAQSTPGIIAMSCFIEIPRIKADELGRPICNQRQTYYAANAENGRRATPMFLLNGSEMINHLPRQFKEFVMPSLLESKTRKIRTAEVQSVNTEYRLTMPELPKEMAGAMKNYEVWAVLVRKPVQSKVMNIKKNDPPKTYKNTIDQLIRIDGWNGKKKVIPFRYEPAGNIEKIVFLAEDNTKKIIAAGELPVSAKAK